jgi:predicted house-cleaning noncanonical NTP pyrophosphatase (MazG superfamily)
MPTYNKLVRDLIPQIIEKKNKSLTGIVLNTTELETLTSVSDKTLEKNGY